MMARRIGPAMFVAGVAFLLTTTVVGSGPASALTNSGGAKLWLSRYNGAANLADQALAVAVSPDGSKVFVTGDSQRNAIRSSDYATIAYDAQTGQMLWSSRYNGSANCGASAIAVSPDGSKVFVTGFAITAATQTFEYATVAYDSSTGAELWAKRYAVGNTSEAFAIAVSPDGSKVFVTGGSGLGSTTGYDYATLAYDAASGKQLWVRRYNGPANVGDQAFAIAVSPDGSQLFVTGSSNGIENSDYATVSYNASTGVKLWVKRYNGPGNGEDVAHSIGVSPNGSEVFVTGWSDGIGTGSDYATVSYDASTGAKIWVKRYSPPGKKTDKADFAYSLAVSPDGSKVFVTGASPALGTGAEDYATVSYDASTGARLWLTRYNGPGNGDDAAYSVGVTPDGSKVFVTGESTGIGTYQDYATVSFEASTGNQLWVRRYDGPRSYFDEAEALAVSPDGSKVFVTGLSNGVSSEKDYATIAYVA